METATSDARKGSELRPERRDVPELVTRYIKQLIDGCGNADCNEVLCRTGIRNTSNGKPVRQFTTRSARTIAVSLCAGPNPRAHLCSHAISRSTDEIGSLKETQSPSDPSSLDQQLSDTRSFKLLQEPGTLCSNNEELQTQHDRVSRLLEAAQQDPSTQPEGCLSNVTLVDGLIPCVEWLLAKLPLHRPASFTMVNDLISKGYAYPTKNASMPVDDKLNNWLTILDTIHHKPYLRLLGRIVQVIAARQAVELALENTYPDFWLESRLRSPSTHCATLFLSRFFAIEDPTPKIFALVVWLKRLAAEHWDGRPEVKVGSICMAVWGIITGIANRPQRKDPNSSLDLYQMPMIWIRLSSSELVHSFQRHFSCGLRKGSYHVLEFKALFSMKQLTLCFRLFNHLKMREANSLIEKSINLMRRYDYFPDEHLMSDQSKHATKHYLVLFVSRGNVLEDAFDQLWQRRKDELRRPLRVRLGEIEEREVGYDLGGVQIEFFNLVCKAIFSVEAQMFVTDEKIGISHFQSGSLQPLHMFELFGILIALAIYNGVTLPISLPRVYYRILAGYPSPSNVQHTIDEIRDCWPALASSMQSMLDEDIPGLEMAYPFEANGIRMQTLLPIGHHSEDPVRQRIPLRVTSTNPEVDVNDISNEIPGWQLERVPYEPKEVTAANKESYITAYVLHTSYCSAMPQWQAFERGFWNSDLIDKRHLRLFSPCQLKALVEGTSKLDIAALRSVTQYDGYSANDPYIYMFWRVVGTWSEPKQKQLLKFVTAAERIPITGGLTFIVKRYESENLERLPTSSTCFGTLMLPMYRSERVLGQKLSLALRYGSEGFGTG